MGWLAALGVALTGSALPEGPDDQEAEPGPPPDPGQVIAALARAGFEPEELARLVSARQREGRPWPFPVPAEERPGIGAAQFVSVLRAVTDALDVHSWQHHAPARDARLTADDRRLLADVPPHW